MTRFGPDVCPLCKQNESYGCSCETHQLVSFWRGEAIAQSARIAELEAALKTARADLPPTVAEALKLPEIAALIDAVWSAWAKDDEPTLADVARILDALAAIEQAKEAGK